MEEGRVPGKGLGPRIDSVRPPGENLNEAYTVPRKKYAPPVPTWIYVPESLEAAKLPKLTAPQFNLARWLLNLIYHKSCNFRRSSGRFIPLRYDYIGEIVGKRDWVGTVRDELERVGMIEVDRRFFHDRHFGNSYSMGYRLGPALADVTFRRFHLDDARAIERFRKYRERARERVDFLPVHHHLADWVERVEVDFDQAAGVVADLRELPPKLPTKRNPRPIQKHEAATAQLDDIQQRVIFHSPCEQGRFHSNLSTLCRELRPTIRHQGQALSEIDLVNAQMLFLMTSLDDFARDRRDWRHIDRERDTETERRVILLPQCTGADEFKADVLAGRIYNEVAEELGIGRDEAKVLVFQVIFGRIALMKDSPVGRFFRRRYRWVYHALMAMKRGGPASFKDVALDLQTRESSVMVRTVCERFRVELPDVPLVCVHDSLCVPPCHLDIAERFIREALDPLGIDPRFRRK